MLRIPSTSWVPDNETARAQWVSENARKYDQFLHLAAFSVTRVVVGDVQFGVDRMRQTLNVMPCETFADDDETNLLRRFWQYFHDKPDIFGWQMNEVLWPRVVNRSLHREVQVPEVAQTNLSKKFLEVPLNDISKIYQMGVYSNYVRPVPRIDYALSFWLGSSFPNEPTVRALANTNKNNEEVTDALCQYTTGMVKVYARYKGYELKWT